MPSVFHHLKEPTEKPTALVKVRDVVKWLGHVAKTEIVIKGKKQTMGQSGVFGKMSDDLITAGDPWEISRGDEGWIIGRGTIAGFYAAARVPKINGSFIGSEDEEDPPLANPPQLDYRTTDGIIAIEASFSFDHDASSGMTPAEASPLLPFRVYIDDWTAWPEIKWADDISISSTISMPNSAILSALTVAVPIARITGGEAYPLRSTNVVSLVSMNSIVAIR